MAHTLLVGIVSLDRAGATGKCVRSVRENSAVPTRLVVADNGSCSPEALALLATLEAQRTAEVLRIPGNRGPSGGKNAVLEAACGEPFVALLDNDAVVLEGWDLAALGAIEDGAGLVQPKLLGPGLDRVDRGPNLPNPDPLNANPAFVGRGAPRHGALVSERSEVAVVGCGIAAREVFEKVGRFDEGLRVGEDYDFSARARREGFRLVYEPRCEMVHDHGFDLAYDVRRGDPSAILDSFCQYWHKHGKCLLCPRYFGWFSWLERHEEPMYLPAFSRERAVFRRVCRRAARAWYLGVCPRRWNRAAAVERALSRRNQSLPTARS